MTDIDLRQTGISGTDASAVMGVSGYQTLADVWLKKKYPDRAPKPEKAALERMYWGNQYEGLIAQEYSKRNNATIFKPAPALFRCANEDLYWVIGSPDFLWKDKKRGVEVKKVSPWMKDEWGASGTDKIPAGFLVQVLHYMALTQFPEWDVACVIGESDYRQYRIHADPELLTEVLQRERDFFERFVKGGEEPNFKDAEELGALLKAKYPNASQRTIEVHPGDKELKDALLALREARAAVKTAKAGELEKKVAVQQHMGDAGLLEWEEELLKITWKNLKASEKVDWQKVALAALERSDFAPEERTKLITDNTEKKPGVRRFTVFDKNSKDEEE